MPVQVSFRLYDQDTSMTKPLCKSCFQPLWREWCHELVYPFSKLCWPISKTLASFITEHSIIGQRLGKLPRSWSDCHPLSSISITSLHHFYYLLTNLWHLFPYIRMLCPLVFLPFSSLSRLLEGDALYYLNFFLYLHQETKKKLGFFS